MHAICLTDFADAYGSPSIADAIHEAAALGFKLNTHADPVADAQLDAAEWYAAEVAAVDPSLVYLTGTGGLDDIDDDEWSRVCGSQDREAFARLAIDDGQTIADAWTDAQRHAQQVLA